MSLLYENLLELYSQTAPELGWARTFGVIIFLLVFLVFLLLPGAAFAYAVIRLIHYRRKAGKIGSTKLSNLGKIKEGYRRARGTVVAREKLLRSPLTSTSCVYYRFKVEEYRGGAKNAQWWSVVNDCDWIDIAITDPNGEAEVELDEAEVVLKSAECIQSNVFNDPPTRLERVMSERHGKSTSGWFFNKSMRYSEEVISRGSVDA